MMDAPVSIPIKSSNWESSIALKSRFSSWIQRMNSRVVMEMSVSMPMESSLWKRAAAFSSSRFVSAFLAVQGFTDTDTML